MPAVDSSACRSAAMMSGVHRQWGGGSLHPDLCPVVHAGLRLSGGTLEEVQPPEDAIAEMTMTAGDPSPVVIMCRCRPLMSTSRPGGGKRRQSRTSAIF
jgi:hypothetical protein